LIAVAAAAVNAVANVAGLAAAADIVVPSADNFWYACSLSWS
jgi:hypothetical protein